VNPKTNDPKMLVVLPALNEERSVGIVVKEVRTAVPDCTILVVDDGSVDDTAAQATEAGAEVVSNPFNLGVGGAMRVGFRVALAHGYDVLVQVDADGQHDARDIGTLVGALDDEPGPQVVIGARFAGLGDIAVPRARRLAMRLLARYLSRVTATRLTDVTSGFRAHNRAGIELFARHYPADYLSDTVESLIIVADAGGRVHQVPVTMRPRLAGSPSQSPVRAAVYLLRVVAVLILSVFRRHSNPNRQRRTEAL
jgi:glycosyltransferase involved in cell wall biosynthesis